MKKLSLLLCTLAISGCSWFSSEDDIAITPAELVDFTAEVSITRSWSANIGSGTKDYLISLRPAADGDTIFAADYSGQVTALNLSSGKQIWQVNLDTMVTGGVGYGSDMVMVGSIEGVVYALNASDGSTLWTSQVSSEILSSPKTNGKVVAVHSIDNQMVALDAKTGEELWRHDGDAPILSVRGTSESVVTSNMVLSGFDSGKLIAFNPNNGSVSYTHLTLPPTLNV